MLDGQHRLHGVVLLARGVPVAVGVAHGLGLGAKALDGDVGDLHEAAHSHSAVSLVVPAP